MTYGYLRLARVGLGRLSFDRKGTVKSWDIMYKDFKRFGCCELSGWFSDRG